MKSATKNWLPKHRESVICGVQFQNPLVVKSNVDVSVAIDNMFEEMHEYDNQYPTNVNWSQINDDVDEAMTVMSVVLGADNDDCHHIDID